MEQQKEYGFALGGGGAKAFAQLGAIKALSEEGILPSYFSGSSMGAVNAILLASGYTVQEIEDFYLSHRITDFFRPGFFCFQNDRIGKAVLAMTEKKGFRKIEDLPKKVYIPATVPDINLRIVLRKGSIDQVVMASTSSFLVHPYLVKDISIRRQLIQQSYGIYGKGRFLYLKDSCYSSNVPFELLDLIRSETDHGKKPHRDVAFDIIPGFKKTYFLPLDRFNKKILANDLNRKPFFEGKDKGLYLTLDFGISQTDFSAKTCREGYEESYRYVKKVLAAKKNSLS
jgi:hypothetical protein